MTVRALQDKKVQSGLAVISRLVPVVRMSRQKALFCRKMTFHIPHILYYKYHCTYEMRKMAIERKTLREVSTTHPPYQRESYSFLERNLCSLFSFPLPLLYPLRGDLYPNTTHTYSECRECFGAQEALEICQKKPVRLGGCNRAYCGFRKAREDMSP